MFPIPFHLLGFQFSSGDKEEEERTYAQTLADAGQGPAPDPPGAPGESARIPVIHVVCPPEAYGADGHLDFSEVDALIRIKGTKDFLYYDPFKVFMRRVLGRGGKPRWPRGWGEGKEEGCHGS